jgi:hypothetical protein
MTFPTNAPKLPIMLPTGMHSTWHGVLLFIPGTTTKACHQTSGWKPTITGRPKRPPGRLCPRVAHRMMHPAALLIAAASALFLLLAAPAQACEAPATNQTNLPPPPAGVFKASARIAINGSAAATWAALIDFPSYPDWNPFVRCVYPAPFFLVKTIVLRLCEGPPSCAMRSSYPYRRMNKS